VQNNPLDEEGDKWRGVGTC